MALSKKTQELMLMISFIVDLLFLAFILYSLYSLWQTGV